MSEQSNDVFISYRRDASGLMVDSLFRLLDSSGIDAFYDIESIGAGRYREIITNQIRRRPYFLLVLAPGTLEGCSDEDDMLRMEIETALACNAMIVPLRTGPFDITTIEDALPERISYEISGFQMMELPPLEYLEHAVPKLIERYLKPREVADSEVPAREQAEVTRIRGLAAELPTATDDQLQSQEYLERGNRKRQDGDLEGAIADYDEAIRLDPDSELAYRTRGTALHEAGDWDAADADYGRAISAGGGFMGTLRSIGVAVGLVDDRPQAPVGCSLGRVVYRETKRSAQVANAMRPRDALRPATQVMLSELFPDLDVDRIRIRTRCRLPSNRYNRTGRVYGMTFGYTIYWRDDFDEDDPSDLVKLIHEVVHIDQTRRLGGEDAFACEYGKGYVAGGGELPAYIEHPSAYHRNPFEAEAYAFDSRFRDRDGRVEPDLLPGRHV